MPRTKLKLWMVIGFTACPDTAGENPNFLQNGGPSIRMPRRSLRCRIRLRACSKLTRHLWHNNKGGAPNGCPRHAPCLVASLMAWVAPRAAVGDLGRTLTQCRSRLVDPRLQPASTTLPQRTRIRNPHLRNSPPIKNVRPHRCLPLSNQPVRRPQPTHVKKLPDF